MDPLVSLCIKVFVCKIVEVAISCYRTVVMVRGQALFAAGLAVVEGLVWFLVIREALVFETPTWWIAFCLSLAYAFGYASGNYVGCKIASKYTGGMVQAQVVMTSKNDEIIKKIQDAGYALTIITSNATSFSGEKYMIFSEMKQSKFSDFKALVHSLDEKAFVMLNETKLVFNGFIKN